MDDFTVLEKAYIYEKSISNIKFGDRICFEFYS